jgi:PAS domain S-box-containing protein
MEDDLRRAVDTIPGLVWCALPDGRVEFLNQRWCDYTGIALDDGRGGGWLLAIHPEDLPRVQQYWQLLVEEGEPDECEARLRRFDGTFRWFLIRAVPLRGETGEVIKWYGQNIDIEDRKRAEAMLAGEKQLLEMIARGSDLSVVLDVLCTLVERTAPDCHCSVLLIDRSRTKFQHGAAPSLPASYTRVIDTLPLIGDAGPCARAVRLKQRVVVPDIAADHEWDTHGWRELALAHGLRSCCSTPILSLDGTVLGTFALYQQKPERPTPVQRYIIDQFTHIASIAIERAQAEDALHEMRSALTHVARVATLGTLTASIAHEINQPLSGIVTNASTSLRMLADDPPNLEGARETARRTIRDANRAADVIARLRALFKKSSVSAELLDLNEATREVLALLSTELQRARVTVRTEFAEHLPRVAGDRVQLQQVIVNLALNAVEAMHPVTDRPRLLTFRTEVDEHDLVRLTVHDTGFGFDPADAGRLFDAFYTTKRDGMGIGLSISRSIIESHRGRLWATIDGGPGATFAFSVPAAASLEHAIGICDGQRAAGVRSR